MSLFVYCYNVSFILLFSAVLSACFMTYGATGRKVFRYFGELFFAYICESIYIVIMDQFAVFDFPEFVRGGLYLASLALFSGVEVYIMGKVVYAMFEKSGRRTLGPLSLGVVCLTVGGLMTAAKAGSFLATSVFSLALLFFCALYRRLLKRETEKARYDWAVKYRGILWIMGIFSIAAIFENAVYTFCAQEVIDRLIPFYGNQINFVEDGFCLLLAAWLLLFTKKERDAHMAQELERMLQYRMNEFQAREQEKSKQVGKEQMVEFCRCYGLTEREAEILRLILEGKSNQELSEELFITIGTVKAHVHSIFGKLEVSRRSQLMTMFVNYEGK